MPVCDVLAEPGNRSQQIDGGGSHRAGGTQPKDQTGREDTQLLLLNDSMVVVFTVVTARMLLACGKREVKQVMLNLRGQQQKLNTFHLMLVGE